MTPPKPDPDFKQVTCGHLAARVYKDGRVTIGAMLEKSEDGYHRVEIEITTDYKNGLEFADKLAGLIKQMSGAYEK